MTYNITTITITIVCTKWIIEELPLLKMYGHSVLRTEDVLRKYNEIDLQFYSFFTG